MISEIQYVYMSACYSSTLLLNVSVYSFSVSWTNYEIAFSSIFTNLSVIAIIFRNTKVKDGKWFFFL